MRRRLSTFTESLQRRLLRGEHLTLYGPRGSGKSLLLERLHARIRSQAVPCGYCARTDSLDEITCALERAYPAVDTLRIARRTARARLRDAAEHRPGVLLLDHFSCTGVAMTSFLRRLHGRIAGVLTAVDVDEEREQSQIKPWRYGALSVRMPLASSQQLKRLLADQWCTLRLPPLSEHLARTLLRAARGRPGWIRVCTQLARDGRYWRDEWPLGTVLIVDTEAAVRYRALSMVRAD